jgi:hypothetical protein
MLTSATSGTPSSSSRTAQHLECAASPRGRVKPALDPDQSHGVPIPWVDHLDHDADHVGSKLAFAQ